MAQQSGRKVVEELSRVWGSVKEGPFLKPVLETQLQRLQQKATGILGKYENFIGISHVKEAQARVLQTEMRFQDRQKERRHIQQKLQKIQDQLRSLRLDIDRTPRGDHRYLELIKSEIDMIRDERNVLNVFEELEVLERETFAELSNALRMSHEKERSQSEKTKYWSILGSIVGAFLGIVGTTLNSRLRHKQTQAVLGQTSSQVQQIEESVNQLALRLDQSNSNVILPTQLVDTVQQFMHTLEEKEGRLENRTEALMLATTALERRVGALFTVLSGLPDMPANLDPGLRGPEPHYRAAEKSKSLRSEIIATIAGLAIIGALVYRSF